MPRAPATWSDAFAAAALIFAGAALFLPTLAILPLTRAEAMYALIPQEMLETGAWLTPTLNGAPYLDKPPLLYWLTLGVYQVFGVSELTARLINFACALGEIWFTYLIGLHLMNRRAAWLGGFVLLSSIGFFSLHLVIYTDHLVNLTLVASLYFFLRWLDRTDFQWVALFFFALAVGFLSKSFIAIVFPCLICGIYGLSRRQLKEVLAFFLSWRGWAIFLMFSLSWLTAMELLHPGFLKHHILNEQIMRFFGQRYPMDIISISIPGFWLLLLLWLLPWTPLLPGALYRFWREIASGHGENPQGRLLLIWAAVVMGFYTLSACRIDYYSLPALPPLALVLGWRLHRLMENPQDRTLCWVLLTLALLGLAAVAAVPSLEGFLADNRREFIGLFESVRPTAGKVMVLIPLLGVVGALAGWRRPFFALAAYGAVTVVLLRFTFQAYLALAPIMSDHIPGEYIRRHAGAADVVVMEYIEEFEYGASLAYYAQRRILMVQRGELPQFPYPVSPEQNYIIPPAELEELWHSSRRVFVLVDDAVPLEAYLASAPLELRLAGKRLLINQAPRGTEKLN
jgi:4-amino-4-deoxy-L-arabinose transferase-like glycosyltransferase